MTRTRWWLLIGAVVVVAAVGVGLGLALTGGSDGEQTTAGAPPVTLGGLYALTKVGDKESDVLARWPKIPYQHYKDNLQEDCYEWQGENLYDLCFRNGVLALKTNF
jgi:hypothetical protein